MISASGSFGFTHSLFDRRGQPTDGDIRQEIVAVHGRVGGIRRRPQVARAYHDRRHVIDRSRLQMVFEIVGSISEKHDITIRRFLPFVIGIAQKLTDRFRSRLAAERLVDILGGNGLHFQPLPAPVRHQRSCRFYKSARADQNPVGSFSSQEPRAVHARDFGRVDFMGDNIAVSFFEAESVHPPRRPLGRIDDLRGLDDSGLVPHPMSLPLARKAPVVHFECIQHHERVGSFGVSDVLDLENVLSFT